RFSTYGTSSYLHYSNVSLLTLVVLKCLGKNTYINYFSFVTMDFFFKSRNPLGFLCLPVYRR
uniref:Uncharacterized protein n=1 Tax=Oryza brachyantha TaxID=4533 RepID=J3M3I9_ORYBR